MRLALATLATLATLSAAGCGHEAPAAVPQPTTSAAVPVSTATSLADALHDRLRADGLLVDAKVAVSAQGGVVTLGGTVTTLGRRERAVAVAETFRGVQAIVDQIVVIPEPPRSDDAIQHEVLRRIDVAPGLRGRGLSVDVRDGRLRLEGTLPSWVLRARAESAAKSVRGVRAVVDDVRVEPSDVRPDAAIAHDVNYRLANDVRLEGSVVAADVRDGIVSLAGNVGSLADKERAVALAWIAGARSVRARGVLVSPELYGAWLRHRPTPATGDTAVTEAARRALAEDRRLDPASAVVDVAVVRGVATLSGGVPSNEERVAAIDDVRNTRGVLDVVDALILVPLLARPDDELRADVREVLEGSPSHAEVRGLEVDVRSGVVRLFGAVPSAPDKEELEGLSWAVPGVRRVESRIVVTNPAPRSPLDVRRRILYSLAWDARVDPTGIGVIVDANGRAILTGTVASAAEARAAVDDAVDAGSASVVSLLRVR